MASTLYIGTSYTAWGGLSTTTLPLTLSQYNDPIVKAKYTTTYSYENPQYPYFVTKKQSYQNDTKLLTEKYSYDSLGRVASYTNAKGETTNYNYYVDEGNNHIEEITTNLEDGKIAKTTLIYGSETGYAYPSEEINYYTNEWGGYLETRVYKTYDMLLGLVRTEMDDEGKITTYTYDKVGRILQKQLPDFFNNYGEYYAVSEVYIYRNGYNLDYMDENGHLYGTTVESYTCYDDGSPSYYNVVNELYDAYGNLRNRMTYNSKWINETKYTYDNLLRVTSSTDANRNITTVSYNPWGEVNETTDEIGNLYVSNYDVRNNRIINYFIARDNIGNYRANTSSNTYKENYIELILDQFDRIVERKVYENWPSISGEISESYYYDIAGNIIGYIDPNKNLNEDGYTKTYEYDELNRVTEIKDALNQVTNVYYTTQGNIASVTMKENSRSTSPITLYTKTFDELGNMISKADASGEAATYSYNSIGLNTESIDRNGNTIYKTYDGLNQINTSLHLSADYSGSHYYEFSYRNPFGYFDELLYEDGIPTTQNHYYYDQSGQIVQKDALNANLESSIKLEYDDTGNLISQGVGVFDDKYYYTNYDYSFNRLTKVQTNGLKEKSSSASENVVYDYYPDGKLKKVTYPILNDNTLLTTEYAYNALGRLTSVMNKKGNTVLSRFAYTYDANGNIISVNDGSTTTTYVYDKLNRLIEIRTEAGVREIYTYDLRGNRLTLSSDRLEFNLVNTEYTYDMENKLKSAAKGSNLTTMEYYADGLRSAKTTTSGFNLQVASGAALEVISVNDSDLDTTVATGAAIKATALDTTLYVYDLTGRLTAEMQDSSSNIVNYVWGLDRVLVKKEADGKEYYYLYNGHGDVVQIVDRSGNIVNNYKYDEWGNILVSNESIDNPFKYAGEVYDEETGLYYLRARYYDPVLGRFINEDSYEGQVTNPLTLNLYTYCNNNPIMYIDPSGNVAITAGATASGIITLVIAAAMAAYSAVEKGKRIENRDLNSNTFIPYPTNSNTRKEVKVETRSSTAVSASANLNPNGNNNKNDKKKNHSEGSRSFNSNQGSRKTVKTNQGNEIDITPSKNHRTTTKNPGLEGKPNSSVDILDSNGNIKTRRWYGPDGKQIRDVDFTNHGNPKKHPEWPHEHGPR